MAMPAAGVPADYFDGTSAAARPVRLRIEGRQLHIDGDGVARTIALADVQWPERSRHGARLAHLAGGGSLRCGDGAQWDAWYAATRRDGLAVRLQQSWRGTAVALVLVLLAGYGGWRWGVPAAGRAALAVVPASVDRELGARALETIERQGWLAPSTTAPAEQHRLREAFAAALRRAGGSAPAYELHFRAAPKLGPNAFALPGGAIVMTDEMLALADGRDDIVLGVLGHELGHVRQRHGMRMVVQTAVIGVAAGAVFGDFSSVLATLPALLGQQAYSRDFEREADRDALAFLRGAGLPPAAMATLFERLGHARERAGRDGLGIALASHPTDEERIRFFRDARP